MSQPTSKRSKPRLSLGWSLHWPWAVGTLLGLVVVGPGLAPGPLLTLDLALTPRIPVPPGIWGLGPALPQRVPCFLPLSWLSTLIGGPAAGKVFLVASVAVAFAGMARLLPDAMWPTRAGAAALYAIGPFALTRMAAGHLGLVAAVALLPWAVPHLLAPSADLRRTFLASLALASTGSAGGTLAGLVILSGLFTEVGTRRPVRVAGLFAAASMVWLGPNVVVLAAGAQVRNSAVFATHAPGVVGWLSTLAGGGFWRFDYQTGATGALGAAAGVALTALAAAGHRDLPERWRRGALALAVIGLVLTFATLVPGVSTAYRTFTDLPLGAPFRESQRALLLWLVWLAPAAAFGARRLAHRSAEWAPPGIGAVLAVGPAAIALLLAGPGLWGLNGRLRPGAFPGGWAEARSIVGPKPGTVLALPWHEYELLSFAGGRAVLNPLPDYLGGDVLSSYDPEFDPDLPSQEQVDHRARRIDGLLPDLFHGRRISGALRQLGVRWVVLAHEEDWARYRSLRADPGLRAAFGDAAIDVLEVRGWNGPVVDARGRAHRLSSPAPPLLRTGAPGGSVVDRSGAPGWMRGWHAATTTADGRLRLPSGGGPIWFWPAAILVFVDLGLAVSAICCVWLLRRQDLTSMGSSAEGFLPCPAPLGSVPTNLGSPVEGARWWEGKP